MSELLHFGIVGVGGIAHSYIEALKTSKVAKLIAVADTRSDVGLAVAESVGCRSYTSHLELADSAECDAVVVCTPPSSHAEIALTFLERRVPVLCEKPLSTDVESACSLCERAQANGVPLVMASKFRHVDDVIRAKSIAASGLVGDIILVENTFATALDMSHRWNSDPAISGGGVLIDNGTHSVDIIRYLMGPVTQVIAVEGARVQELQVEDSVTLFMQTERGADARADLSWSIDKERDSYITVYGSRGIIQVGWAASRYRQLTSPNWVPFGQGYDKIAALRGQVINFCNHISIGETLSITPKDALASVQVIQAAYESIDSGRWVAVRPSRAEIPLVQEAWF